MELAQKAEKQEETAQKKSDAFETLQSSAALILEDMKTASLGFNDVRIRAADITTLVRYLFAATSTKGITGLHTSKRSALCR